VGSGAEPQQDVTSICPSVDLSVSHAAKHALILFLPRPRFWVLELSSSSRTVFEDPIPATPVFFPHQTVWQYSNGGVECKGYEKIAIFDQYRAFLSEMIQDKAILTTADQ